MVSARLRAWSTVEVKTARIIGGLPLQRAFLLLSLARRHKQKGASGVGQLRHVLAGLEA